MSLALLSRIARIEPERSSARMMSIPF